MSVLAIDPGPHTGLALYDQEVELFRAWTVEGQMEAVEAIRDAIIPPQTVVCERFTIAGPRAKFSNITIEIIGAARWFAYDRGITFIEQAPADALGFATNEKLKRLGWYLPGEDHSRDATRHLVLYLAKTGVLGADRLLQSDER